MEFSENRFCLMLTRQTNVRKEVLFYVDFYGWVGKNRVSGVKKGREYSENRFGLM